VTGVSLEIVHNDSKQPGIGATAVDPRKTTRLRSWGETSEASADIIALRICAATSIPHIGLAFRDVKPDATSANL
jgi:hypothetical protein